MKIEIKLKILNEFYETYEKFVSDDSYVCKKFCSHCCTSNLTVTTLEVYKIISQFAAKNNHFLLEKSISKINDVRFIPKLTVNKMAELCSRKENIPEEDVIYEVAPCIALSEGKCRIYNVRPFCCRCMFSTDSCKRLGSASMDSFLLTVNSVFIQCIEHIDSYGFTGNFYDVLRIMSSKKFLYRYEHELMLKPAQNTLNLLKNQPIRSLILPQEHIERVQPLLAEIKHIGDKYNSFIFS